MSAIQTAISGTLAASGRFDKAAARTAADAGSGRDLLSDLVEQMEARLALKANISVVRTADAMTGRMLDIKA